MKKQIFAGILASAMAVTCAATVSAVEKTDAITGNHTVTGFFNEKTDAIEIKDGESYTISFHNKSNGSNNYENFVLAIVGEVGDAYTGADQEVLIVRADAWGWGGGYSDLVAPDGSGNALAFESDVNWDTWGTEMGAGVDVVINLKKSGNTITYDAKVGAYSIKTTATSGKALPDTVYAFLTGENVELTNIKTVKNGAAAPAPDNTNAAAPGNTNATTPNKGTPDTGVEGVAVVAGIAIVAAGAIVVAKKRK